MQKQKLSNNPHIAKKMFQLIKLSLPLKNVGMQDFRSAKIVLFAKNQAISW